MLAKTVQESLRCADTRVPGEAPHLPPVGTEPPPGRPVWLTLMHVSEQPPDLTAEWWTTSDVATYIGVNVATVSAYRVRGQMPLPDMTVGRTHMWRPARIVEWHAARKRMGVGGRPKSDPGLDS